MTRDPMLAPDGIDALPEETAKPANHRSELVGYVDGIGAADIIANFATRAAVATRKLKRIRTEDCPACQPNTSVFNACPQRNCADVDHGFDTFPFCKHADARLVQLREKQRTNQRFDRLKRYGVGDPEILRIAGPAATPPKPLSSWFDDALDVTAFDRAVAALEYFVDRRIPETLLVLEGARGAGKSVLAGWALGCVSTSAFWLSAPQVPIGEFWKAVRLRCVGTDVLNIDDLGREEDGANRWVVEALKGLMCDRLDGPGLTIVTTNLTSDAFIARYGADPTPEEIARGAIPELGARLMSRMNQRCRWVKFGRSTDLRARAKFANRKPPRTADE